MRLLGTASFILFATGCGQAMVSYEVDSGVDDSAPWWDTNAQNTDDSGTDTVTDSGDDSDDPFNDTDTSGDTSSNSAGYLILHEICDHSEEGQVKYVEIANPGSSPVSLVGYSLELYSNGNSSPTSYDFPAASIPAGGTFVLSNAGNGADIFTSLYGREADDISGIANGNGDDVYALAYNGSVVDVYGEVGVDGTGEPWEYKDSVAKRSAGAQPSPFFSMSSWTVHAGSSQSKPFSPN